MDFSFAKVLQIYLERWPWFLGMIGQQLFISLVSIAIAGTLGLLIGIFIAEHRRFAEPVIAVCNVFYTIPAIALIALLIPIAGIGAKNAVIAIILYGLMPMVRNTYTGITSISPELLDAAVGHGQHAAPNPDAHQTSAGFGHHPGRRAHAGRSCPSPPAPSPHSLAAADWARPFSAASPCTMWK